MRTSNRQTHVPCYLLIDVERHQLAPCSGAKEDELQLGEKLFPAAVNEQGIGNLVKSFWAGPNAQLD